MTRLALMVVSLALPAVGCVRPGRTPHDGLFPPITQEYHACSTCRSLHGGIYGKGPTFYLKAVGAEKCRHTWVVITRPEFQSRGESEFSSQWVNAAPFFKLPAQQ